MNRRAAHFRVFGKLDRSVPTEGTLTIADDLVTVRPLRARGERAYTMPLGSVADLVVLRVVRARLVEKRLERARQRSCRASTHDRSIRSARGKR